MSTYLIQDDRVFSCGASAEYDEAHREWLCENGSRLSAMPGAYILYEYNDLPADLKDVANAYSMQEVTAAAQAKAAAVQAEKVRARDAGFLVDGVLFDSDQSARISYAELALRLASDPTFVTPWKASAGAWVTMDATKYAQVAATGGAHIQAVFAWQAARDAEIATILAGTGTSDEKLTAIAAVSSTYEAE